MLSFKQPFPRYFFFHIFHWQRYPTLSSMLFYTSYSVSSISFKLTKQLFLLWKTMLWIQSTASYLDKSWRGSPNPRHLIRPCSFSKSINTNSKYCLILILYVFYRFASKVVAYAIEQNTSCFFVYTRLLSMYKHWSCKHVVISADGR